MFNVDQESIPAVWTGKLRSTKLSGGDIQERAAQVVIIAVRNGKEKIVLTCRKNIGVRDRAGCDDTGDSPLYQFHTFLRRFHLVANGDLIAFAEQAGNIAVRGVVGNAAHSEPDCRAPYCVQ